MKTTVYLIRHAEAEGNVYRRCHGQYDSLLTPRAYEQLRYLAKRFENVHLDAVYSSDLFRARTTAEAVAEPHGLTVEALPVLREIDMGDWEDLTWAELPRLWPEEFALWKSRPWESHPPHGETPIEAGRRVLDGVRGLVRRNEGKTIAVATHGSAIRGALTLAHGWRPDQLGQQNWGDNTCVSRLDFDGDSVDVVYENDASHLPEELSTFASVGWKNKTGMPETLQMWFRRADPLDKQDSERLVAYMRELHRCAYGTDAGLEPDILLQDMLEAQRVTPRAVTFGCLENTEEPVSLCYLKAQYDAEPDTGLVGGLCIDEKYRGCGLSQQLLGQAVSVYRALGKKFICAHAGKNNARAIGFYQKSGFEQRGGFEDKNGSHLRMFRKISTTP